MTQYTPIVDLLPGIRRIALIIAYDSGKINRLQTEESWLRSLDEILGADGVYEDDLTQLSRWCTSLTDEQAEILGAGEHEEKQAIEALCPRPELCGIFSDIFEH